MVGGVWVFGCLGDLVFGCLSVWLFGCLSILGVWVFGCGFEGYNTPRYHDHIIVGEKYIPRRVYRYVCVPTSFWGASTVQVRVGTPIGKDNYPGWFGEMLLFQCYSSRGPVYLSK